MDPFFPEFLFGARCLWKNVQRDLISALLLSREWTFSDEVLETRIPIEWIPSAAQLILSYHRSLIFCWAALVTMTASLFLACNSDIREDASNYLTGLDSF